MLGNELEQTPAGANGGRVAGAQATTRRRSSISVGAGARARAGGAGAARSSRHASGCGRRRSTSTTPPSTRNHDAMFAQGTQQALDAITPSLTETDTRELLRDPACSPMFDFTTSDPARAELLFQRMIPGFEQTPEAYAACGRDGRQGPGRVRRARDHRSRGARHLDRARSAGSRTSRSPTIPAATAGAASSTARSTCSSPK